MRFPSLLDDAIRDMRYALRVLLRSPLFTLVAICSLAIGIGGRHRCSPSSMASLRNLPVMGMTGLFSSVDLKLALRMLLRYPGLAGERPRSCRRRSSGSCPR